MSKIIPSALAAHYASQGTTLAKCLLIVRADNVVLGLTSTDRSITVSGQVYHPGFTCSDLVSAAGLDVDNFEASIFPGESALTQAELAAGLWDNASFTIFEVNFKVPTDGINTLERGTTGQAQLNRDRWTVEFRGLKQALQQTIVEVTSKTCRYRLGDLKCKVNLATYTVAGTITTVTSSQVFRDSAQVQAADWFKDGSVKFLTGANTGFARKVKSFSGGVFTFTQAFPFVVTVGDTFTAIAGCQHRLIEDCKTKFNNVLNFGGEPHMPGTDGLTAIPKKT